MTDPDDRNHEAGDGARETDTQLPVSRALAAAWGYRDYPSKGPKPGLSLTRILDTAIHTAQTDGLAAVSMKRVADELGTAAMSLYRYVSSKDELLSLMVDQAVGPPPTDLPSPTEDWRAGLSRWAWSLRAVWQRHTWALPIPITGPPVAPHQVRWFERGLRCLADTGLAEGEKLGTILLLSGFVRNEAMLTAEITAALQRSEQMATTTGYSRMLRELTDPERFPAVTTLLDSGFLDGTEDSAEEMGEGRDDDFVFGLERILDGIRALIQSRSTS